MTPDITETHSNFSWLENTNCLWISHNYYHLKEYDNQVDINEHSLCDAYIDLIETKWTIIDLL